MTVQAALNAAVERLNAASIADARRDAEVLLAHLLHRDRAWLLAHSSDTLDDAIAAELSALAARRAQHEPLQYLTGEVEFFGLRLRVTPATLIPRPETEHLVETVLAWAKQHPKPLTLIDVGTGSGAIAIALAAHLEGANVHACDLSHSALLMAIYNAARVGVAHPCVKIDFRQSDLLAAYADELAAGLRFDCIVSNPPYVLSGDAAGMQPEVRDHEPHSALFAGEDGLAVYRRLVPQARAALRPGGLLAMEIGFGQRDAIASLLDGWRDVRFLDDYAGIPRVALAAADSAPS